MNDHKKQNIFWLMIGTLVIGFLGVKYLAPGLIEKLYQSNQVEVLNKWTGAEGKMAVGFYLGKMDDLWLGPAQSFLAAFVFLMICFQYFQLARPLNFALAVFSYLVMTRPEVLVYPPYADTLTGAFSDAIWLLRHHFNYVQYFHAENVHHGGAVIYPDSFYPSFLALLMRVLPSSKIFLVVMHLFVFVYTATIVAIFREILRKVTGDKIALAASLIFLVLPLTQSQSELINLEMPSLLFAIVSAYYLVRKDWGLACGMAILSSLVKAHGALACLAVFIIGMTAFFIESQRKDRFRALGWGIIALVSIIGKAAFRKAVLGNQVLWYNTVSFLIGWPLIKTKPYFWIYLAVLFVFVVRLTLRWMKSATFAHLKTVLQESYPALVMFVMAGAWFVIYLNFSSNIYRYELILMPFYIFTLVYTFFIFVKDPKVVTAVLSSLVLFLSLCAYGRWIYPKDYQPGGNQFERSLEYRNDLKLHMDIAKEIEEHYADYTIGAPVITAQTLNFREVGYVSKPLDVVMYGMKSPHEGIRDFSGLKNLNLRKTVWVGLGVEMREKPFRYPVHEYDKILHEFYLGDKMAVLFQGGLAIEKLWTVFQMYEHGLIPQKL